MAGRAAACAVLNPMTVTELRTESRSNPPGVDERRPRLGWSLQSDQRNQAQSAYEVLVTSSEAIAPAWPQSVGGGVHHVRRPARQAGKTHLQGAVGGRRGPMFAQNGPLHHPTRISAPPMRFAD